jgi:uncharacterized protein (DUF58 family)
LKSLVSHIKDLFFGRRVLFALFAITFIFCLGFPFPVFIAIGKICLLALIILLIIDISLLYSVIAPFTGSRTMEAKLSNGDYNPVALQIQGRYAFRTQLKIVDELPFQLQLRNRHFTLINCAPGFNEQLSYKILPTERGEYDFGDILVFTSTLVGLVSRRVRISAATIVKVYPSIIQYRKFAYLAISNRLEEAGVKKVRQIGISNEFEQIRDYVNGDDYRIINWKATARKNDLMVNQYEQEKAQNVYCLIDKGRLMHMPFEGLALADYAINSALVLSGIAIGKGDKAGLITFSDKIGSFIVANSKPTQMQQISEALYNQETRSKDADFLRLYKNIRSRIKKRSLMVLFTNFDSLVTLNRQIRYIQALAKRNLVCVVIFENTEINKLSQMKVSGINGMYKQTIAEKFQYDKQLIRKELMKNGIYCILTEPKDLTINTINQYIEYKARGII